MTKGGFCNCALNVNITQKTKEERKFRLQASSLPLCFSLLFRCSLSVLLIAAAGEGVGGCVAGWSRRAWRAVQCGTAALISHNGMERINVVFVGDILHRSN